LDRDVVDGSLTPEHHESGYAKCGAKTRQPPYLPCKRPAGAGTTHVGTGACRLHGGSTKNGIKAAQKQIAAKAVGTYGLPRDVDPATALLEEVHRTAGHVEWLGQVVGALKQKALVWGRTKKKIGGDDRGTTFQAGENAFLALYNKERAHLVRVTSEAIKAGVEERRVRVEEHRAEMIVTMLGGIFDNLDLTDEQVAKLNELMPKALLELDSMEAAAK
jgi:hypothetical protein